jgi:hypothetical protein
MERDLQQYRPYRFRMKGGYFKQCGSKSIVVVPLIEAKLVRAEKCRQNLRAS